VQLLKKSDDEIREVTDTSQMQMPVQEEGLSASNDEVTEKTEAEKQRLVKGKGEAMNVTNNC